MSDREARARSVFQTLFGDAPAYRVSTPGRVNLIGEHTDYNGGWVLPFAINRSVIMAAGEGAGASALHALDREETVEFDAGELPPPRPGHWSNYLIGVMAEFRDAGFRPPQVRAVFSGDIPAGGGLSSSAALENTMALLLDRMIGSGLSRETLALMSQSAEHRYAGVRCGIMDQYATLLGTRGSALLLDCRTGEYRHVPLTLGRFRFLLCNSMVKHDLATSGYNQRRRECESALEKMRAAYPDMRDLRDATLERLREARPTLSGAEFRRALHQVEENARVLEAEQALREDDLPQLGRLMADSHRSLRENFEVTVPETDFLAKHAMSLEGVLGARMTGGGFGGNVIALVEGNRTSAFIHDLGAAYKGAFGLEAEIFECEPGDRGRVDELGSGQGGRA